MTTRVACRPWRIKKEGRGKAKNWRYEYLASQNVVLLVSLPNDERISAVSSFNFTHCVIHFFSLWGMVRTD